MSFIMSINKWYLKRWEPKTQAIKTRSVSILWINFLEATETRLWLVNASTIFKMVWEFFFFPQHSNSPLNRIIIGAVIQDSIILTLRFVEVKDPSQMLASTLNIPYSFSGQLEWKQLEFNSPHSVLPITSMCPSLQRSVIWSPGKHSSGSLEGAKACIFSVEAEIRPSSTLLPPLTSQVFATHSSSPFGGGLPLNRILSQIKCYRHGVPFKLLLNKMPRLTCAAFLKK